MIHRPRVAKFTLGALFLIGSVGACGGDDGGGDGTPGGDGTATGATCPTGSPLSYENFGKALIATNCLVCHASQTPRLTSQAEVRAVKDQIDREAASGPNATNRAMPQGGSLSDEDRKNLGEWLACGAL